MMYNIEATIDGLFRDAKHDHFKVMKTFAKNLFSPIKPSHFKNIYLSISPEQGEELYQLIKKNGSKKIIEFGTSFGISTLFLAKGALETGGNIVTTELLASKADKARESFKEAGVSDLIEIRVGNAIETLKDYSENIDLLVLDGWKDLYLPLFILLEPNFHKETLIYVDNADMAETKKFLKIIDQQKKYKLQYKHNGKAVLIKII